MRIQPLVGVRGEAAHKWRSGGRAPEAWYILIIWRWILCVILHVHARFIIMNCRGDRAYRHPHRSATEFNTPFNKCVNMPMWSLLVKRYENTDGRTNGDIGQKWIHRVPLFTVSQSISQSINLLSTVHSETNKNVN